MPRPDPPTETWMDAQQYAQLSADDKKAISAAVEIYEKAEAAADVAYEIALAEAKKAMTDTIADIVEKYSTL